MLLEWLDRLKVRDGGRDFVSFFRSHSQVECQLAVRCVCEAGYLRCIVFGDVECGLTAAWERHHDGNIIKFVPPKASNHTHIYSAYMGAFGWLGC